MTSSEALEWMMPLALTTAVVAGFLIVLVSIRNTWIRSAVAWSTIAFALLGSVLILAPKWQKLTAKYDKDSASVELAAIEIELRNARTENRELKSQIERVAQLSTGELTAASWLDKAQEVKKSVSWADFIPSDSRSLKVPIEFTDRAAAQGIMDILNKPQFEWDAELKKSGYVILRDVKGSEISKLPATQIWLNPVK